MDWKGRGVVGRGVAGRGGLLDLRVSGWGRGLTERCVRVRPIGGPPTARGGDRPLRKFGPVRPPFPACSEAGTEIAAEERTLADHGVRL